MELENTQKGSAESLKSLENDLMIENLDVHETVDRPQNMVDLSSSASCELRFASERL